jgi:tetratricopeptide (TPR) repeat protein
MVILITWRLQSGQHGTLGDRLDIYSYVIRWISYSPIWGHGTGATPYIFSHRVYAIGGDEVYQAHNLWLQTALESGLLGLFLFILAVGFIIRAYFSSWQKCKGNPIKRASMAAYIGIGVAVLLQSVLDNMFWKAAYEVALIIIIALVYSLAPKKEFITIRKLYIIPILGFLLIASTAGLLYLERGMIPYREGKVAANEWDWTKSREKICQAADIDPGNAFYSFQCSLANAYLAEINNDLGSLSESSSYLQQGLDINSKWYAHWANLASYEWKLGNQESAVEIMRQSVDLAPSRTYLWLNLARMEDQLGNRAEAIDAYLVSICKNPSLENSIIFSESELFQYAATEDCPPRFEKQSYSSYRKQIEDGGQAFQSGEFADAEIHFQQAALSNPQSGIPIAYLALVHSQDGRPQQSDKELKIAFFIDDQSVSVRMIAAKIEFSRGNEEQGFEYLTEAFKLLELRSQSGKYYAFSYFEKGLPTDMSPLLPTVFINHEQKETFLNLASYLKDTGNLELSQRVEKWLDWNLNSLN